MQGLGISGETSQRAAVPALRIAIIAHGMRRGGGLSVGRNLLAALGRVAPQNEYLAIVTGGVGYEEVAARMRSCRVEAYEPRAWVGRWTYDRYRLPGIVASFAPDIVFAMGGKGLLHPPCPQVAFPQDAHLFYPTKHFADETAMQKALKWYHRRHLARQLHRTDLVLCQTSVVERRIRESFGYGGRTFVCSSAVSPAMLAGRSIGAMPDALRSLGGRFKFFCPSYYLAHKNLDRVVDMIDRYRSELAGSTIILTVSAEHHPRAGRFLRRIEGLQAGDLLFNVGTIPHEHIGRYYAHVDALLMPTTLETFCIPYLEAMNFGLPIATSDLDFARDVCGDAAVYFDPWRIESMHEALKLLRHDADLRSRLAARGTSRLSGMFRSWDEIAADINRQFLELVDRYRR